ncbi:hypothetical protein SAMN04488029_0120 [Reichenbachiella faecimaris]|uniref:Uncharacterized protein n=2 Tax=Reichenbachiella faecimaris TaxID=692418 RepID=A0A1W2G5A8_REIFA|nr:hypothetical protein SAMN04488029_0120 [Reichenbachiella faecimaris]
MLFLSLLFGSCGADDNESNTQDIATFTYQEAKEEYEILKDRLDVALTRIDELPTSGVAIYTGMHSGEFFARDNTSESKIDYFANVELTVDFDSQTLTAQITNFTTNLENFENPEGEILVGTGVFRFDTGGDEIGFSMPVRVGNLTQGNKIAVFDASAENKGRFFGNGGQSMWLRVSSTFNWIQGSDAGTTSATVGHMYAVME